MSIRLCSTTSRPTYCRAARSASALAPAAALVIRPRADRGAFVSPGYRSRTAVGALWARRFLSNLRGADSGRTGTFSLGDASAYWQYTLHPRVRSLRAEYPSHDLLRRLPKTFSRDELAAGFLRRYLALFDGALGELDAKSTLRHPLIDPLAAPLRILPWLASFVGLVVDERWPENSKRQILKEAIWLFRFRGTIPGLKRFLQLYTGTKIIIIEKYRLRGLGSIGEAGGLESRSILGAGFRVGGAIGETDQLELTGTQEDAFDTHAHRFSVIIPASLSAEQLSVVQQILDVHRPAHTLVDVCTVGAGMRVGRGLHVELTSIVGRTGGFSALQLGGSPLGRGSIVGQPRRAP